MSDDGLLRIELRPRDHKLFHLNMIRLGHEISKMRVTVEERRILTELLKSYFGDEIPDLPWNAERAKRWPK